MTQAAVGDGEGRKETHRRAGRRRRALTQYGLVLGVATAIGLAIVGGVAEFMTGAVMTYLAPAAPQGPPPDSRIPAQDAFRVLTVERHGRVTDRLIVTLEVKLAREIPEGYRVGFMGRSADGLRYYPSGWPLYAAGNTHRRELVVEGQSRQLVFFVFLYTERGAREVTSYLEARAKDQRWGLGMDIPPATTELVSLRISRAELVGLASSSAGSEPTARMDQ